MGDPKRSNDLWYQCLVSVLAVFTFLFLIFTTLVSFYQSAIRASGLDLGLFENDVGDITDKFYLDFTPADWTFAIIWPIIFLFQWGWTFYVVISLCRRNQFGPVFVNPPIISPFVLWVYCVNLAITTAWLFIWDQELLKWSFVVLVLALVTLVMVLISHHRSVDQFGIELQQNHKRDLWAIRILMQNGLMTYLTWITLATHIGLGTVMTYEGDVDQSTTSTVLLAMLGVIMIVFFILENFVWEKYLRYTYSFWGVVVWALLGIFVKNWGLSLNAIISLVLLIIASILGLIKIALSIMRTNANPLYTEEKIAT